MNTIDELGGKIQSWSFRNFELLGVIDDARVDAKIYNYGEVRVFLYRDGDIEIDGSLYQSIMEKYDYDDLVKPTEWIQTQLNYIDKNYKNLKLRPELWPRPMLNRLFDWVHHFWRNSNNGKKM